MTASILARAQGGGIEFNSVQSLTTTQQAQARANIGTALDLAAAKAWVNFAGGASAATIKDSYNVASVAGSAAAYTVNFTTAFANNLYVVTGLIWFTTSGHAQFMRISNLATNAAGILCLDTTFNPAQPDQVMLAFFGRQ